MTTLFLDACTIIYLVEASEPWRSRVQNTMAELHEGDPDALVAVSDLSRLECRVHPMRNSQQELLTKYDDFFSADGLTVVPLSLRVIDLATVIRSRSNLRTADALQAACCLSLDQPALFITNDVGFRREAALEVVLI